MMIITPSMAQVFISDEEAWEHVRVATESPNLGVMIPLENVEYDQYVPVGNGLLILSGLGFAYMVGKRKKDE